MDTIIQSPNDNRLYRTIQLQNKLTIVLISDPECDKSAAAMNVNVGCLEDPIEREGLAHYLEHMLFLGTEKYPDEAEYNAYLSKNAGSHNAYTDLMETNFFFQCSNEAFEGGLDRFSGFFTNPLFTESCAEREMKAVNSEHEKNLQNDYWRKLQVTRFTAKKGNAMNKFGTGSLQTLQHPNIRQDLINFHKQFYSANLMKLVFYSKFDLDTQEKWANAYFSQIPNQNIERVKYTQLPFDKENMGELFKVVPIKNKDQLEFFWVIDNQLPLYKNSPAKIISHLIGHEGENSLLALLKEEGLALELTSYPWNMMNLFTGFYVDITLTQKGLEQYDRVVKYMFKYIKMLREKGSAKWIFDEINQIEKLKFDNKDKSKGMGYVLQIAANMQKYDLKDVLIVDYLMETYNEDLIKKTIQNFRTDNLRITLRSQSLENDCNLTEPVYGTKFAQNKFEQWIHDSWDNPQVQESKLILDLPVKNIFIPQNMKLACTDFDSLPKYPSKIIENDNSDVFFKQDNTFKTPKASVFLRIYTNDMGIGKLPETEIYVQLWNLLLADYMKDLTYLAEMAYLESTISYKNGFLDFQASGFNDSMSNFIKEYFKKVASFDATKEKQFYEDRLEHIKQKYQNFFMNQPYQQGFTYQVLLLQSNEFDIQDLYNLLKENKITFEGFCSFCQGWLKNIRFEWLITGNLTIEQAKEIVNSTQDILLQQKKCTTLSKSKVLDCRSVCLTEKKINIWERKLQGNETNSLYLGYFQYKEITKNIKLLLDLTQNILQQPLYSQLRTQQQLGYIVMCTSSDMRGVAGFGFLLQSDVKCSHYLATRVEIFLQGMKDIVNNLSDEEFEKYRQSVKINIMEKDTSLYQECSKYWLEIEKHRYMFDRRAQLLEALSTISKKDVQNFFEELFFSNNKQLELHLISKKHEQEYEILKSERIKSNIQQFIYSEEQNIDQFKKGLPLYPDFNLFK